MRQFRQIDNEIYHQITIIASSFKLFECEPCTQAIQEFLIHRGISGKLIKLYTYTGQELGKYGDIYHDKLQKNIATN